MNFRQIIKDYFSFNKKERRGIFVMITILMVMILFDIFLPEVLPGKNPDFLQFSREIAEFEKEVAAADSLEKMKRGGFRRSDARLFPESESADTKPSSCKFRDELVVDLNSSDTFELQQLRGIGPAFARRIVRYREKLGGFTDKSQVREVFGMDEERYKAIEEHLLVGTDSVRRIDLNAVTFKELLSHPYFPFGITKNIMIYRKEHKRFMDVNDLRNIREINDSIFRKMKPYIRIE